MSHTEESQEHFFCQHYIYLKTCRHDLHDFRKSGVSHKIRNILSAKLIRLEQKAEQVLFLLTEPHIIKSQSQHRIFICILWNYELCMILIRRLLRFSSFLRIVISAFLVIDTLYRINRKQAVAVTVKENPSNSPDLKPRFSVLFRIQLHHLHIIV